MRAMFKTVAQFHYAINDQENTIGCPKCKSMRVQLFSKIKDAKSLFWFIFGFYFLHLRFIQNINTDVKLVKPNSI